MPGEWVLAHMCAGGGAGKAIASPAPPPLARGTVHAVLACSFVFLFSSWLSFI